MNGGTTYEQSVSEEAGSRTAGLLGEPSTWTGLYVLGAVMLLIGIRKGFARLGTL